jgi:excisionase family DNA binding protein
MSTIERETYLSTRELMDMLSISRSTVYRMVVKGMPNIMVGSVHRFPMDRVVDWFEAIRVNTESNLDATRHKK